MLKILSWKESYLKQTSWGSGYMEKDQVLLAGAQGTYGLHFRVPNSVDL